MHESIIEFEIHSTKVFEILAQPYLLLAYPHFFVVSNTTHVIMDLFIVPIERPALGLVGCFVVGMFKMIKLVINMCFHFTFDFQGYLYIVIDNFMFLKIYYFQTNLMLHFLCIDE